MAVNNPVANRLSNVSTIKGYVNSIPGIRKLNEGNGKILYCIKNNVIAFENKAVFGFYFRNNINVKKADCFVMLFYKSCNRLKKSVAKVEGKYCFASYNTEKDIFQKCKAGFSVFPYFICDNRGEIIFSVKPRKLYYQIELDTLQKAVDLLKRNLVLTVEID